jgi:hypothetical protein
MNDSRRLLPIALAFSFLAGCDSGSTDKDKKGSVSAEARLEQAQKLLDEAKDAGADKIAAEEFETYSKKLEDAQKLIEDGKGDKSISKISSASGGFKDLIQRVGDFKKNQASATESKKKADAAVAAAKRVQVDVNAREQWEDVEKLYEKANADLQDPKKVQTAAASFNAVVDRIKVARQSADSAKQWKDKAEAQMKVAKEKQGQAVQERATATDLTIGQQFLLEADSDFKNGKFQESFIGYQRADQAFADALSRAKEAKEVAGSNMPAADPAVTPPADLGAGGPKKEETPGAEPAAAAEKVAKKGAAEPAPEAGKVAEGELSADDEDFLTKNISKFCAKRPVEYDPGTGTITVEYPFGDEMKKDLYFPRKMDPAHIQYKDPTMQIGSKEAKGQKDVGTSFIGNTLGFFLLPFPFKDSITYEYNCQIALMKSEGTLTAVFMSSKDAKSYLGANFGTIEVWRDGRLLKAIPPSDPKYKRSPNMWYSKITLGGVAMRITLEANPDPKKGSTLKIFYNLNDGGDDQPICAAQVPSRSGFAGFAWSNTKFQINQWKITGKLDKVMAVKLLKEKMGMGEAGAGEGTEKGGKGAGAKGGEEAAAKPKKSPDAKKAPAAAGEDGADY